MSKIEGFLSAKDEAEIIEAIRTAEQNTSGEIRIHIEESSNIAIQERALEVFHFLKMNNAKLQNGVLIYVATEDKSFAIYGDKGINDLVATNFWDSTKDVMQKHFKLGNFKQGLKDGVLKAGEQLEKHFPWLKGDTDELSNEISKG